MQKRIFIFSFFLFANFSFAQVNLVPNSSFEDTVNCPVGDDELYKTSGWSSYKYSPDYMNSCCTGAMGVPFNWGGFQLAASGNAYVAFATYASPAIFSSNSREYLGRLIYSPLAIGTKYYVSFKVSLAISNPISANCASNKMGVMFSTIPYNVFNPAPITNNPPIYTNSIITDTLNWARIFGSFISDSLYSYIIIGNFFDDNNTDTLIMDTDTLCQGAYYFLDDVCVSTDSLFTLNYNYTSIEENSFNTIFSIYPNPAQDYIFIENINEPYNLRIYSALGQELYFKENINEKKNLIDLKNFNAGLLFINITAENYNLNSKLLKQ
jgi:Secretion system C-terminal sorting domain